MKEGIIQSKSKRFFVACFCFLCGISVSSFLWVRIEFIYLYAIGLSFLCLVILFRKEKAFFFLFLCFSFFLFGLLRYERAFHVPEDYRHIAQAEGERFALTAFVSAEPDVRQDGVRYVLEIENEIKIEVKNRENRIEYKDDRRSKIGPPSPRLRRVHWQGKMYVKYGLYPRFEYGDVLAITCTIKKPEPIEMEDGGVFRYDMYLARFGVFAMCDQPYLEKIDDGDGNVLLRQIFSFKAIIAEKINRYWHEPYAGFMAGLLYGYRGGLGSLNDLFARTGVTHIIAISGYNITIIATILMTFCMQLCIPRKKAFWLIIVGITLFVIFAGASASVVRAGIMGVIVLVARQLGRASQVGNVLLFTAVAMSLHNPFVLIWDAGFQLSFLSTLGLVYFVPMVEKPFEHVPEVLGIKESFLSTIAATLVTLPLILYQFERFSVVSIVVNVLILWILPWVMMGGFFTVLFSFIFSPFAQMIALLSWLGMHYVVLVVRFFAALPFAAVDVSFSLWFMVLSYVLMMFMILKFRRENID